MRERRTLLLVLAVAVVAATAGCTAAQTSGPSPSPASDTAVQASGAASGTMSGMSGGSTAATLTADAGVGETIWATGRTPAGKVVFTGGSDDVGNGACANCHGDKAQGGDGPMIGWSMLSAKGGAMKNMPRFSYSSPDQVYVAVTTGVRPDGTQLSANMPRYQLPRADFDQLMVFLKTK